ncbi:hypothetical protein EX30DRAFT_131 [Ascodesmis nigricans]|uniref:ABC transporter domain-containing protein n=1 Tax=Ascodesmis nigricans TaxID=341454 RepID=A0A4S2N5E3_9PEZI|nr:hypothetical protein EX30DRAFT_131 [Ascodesmis nigricans]
MGRWRRRRMKRVRTLLTGFTGVVRPGEMCLVLGRPGSGCSTFLKVIANQREGFSRVEGGVTYGGESAEVMGKRFRNEVVYNPEEDLHYATMTVKETLKFALKTRTPPKESRNEGESRSDYVQEFLSTISKLFWIDHTLNTKVGNTIIRGVSGGEKKRVSIAEAMVTKASCQCWDNSTKGLDASTANEYVSSLRAMTNMANITTFVALYQAGESLYDHFDKVLLIYGGRCAYFGPVEDAKEYFQRLGFACPPRWTTADFLTSTTDVHARHVRKGWENRVPRTPEEFESAYRKSAIAKGVLREMREFEEELGKVKAEREREMTEETRRKNYQIPFRKQVYQCAVRQFQVLKGDPATLYGKWGGILFQSLIVGSLFFQLPESAIGVFPRGGIMFFTLLFNSLLALSEISVSFNTRPILLKHKSFSFYRPSAYALGLVLADLPQVAVQTLLWSVVIYFMAGLQQSASQFFTFLIITYFLTLALFSFFRSIAAFCGSLDVASRITGLAIQALVIYTGYLIPPESMHPWFSWIRWINPVAYSFESIMTNEFNHMKINCQPPYLIPSEGPDVDPEHQTCLIQGSKSGEVDVDGADYLSTAYNYVYDNLWRNLAIVIGFWIFFSLLYALGLEMLKPNQGGAAVTVYKRGEAPDEVESNENTAPPLPDEEKDVSSDTSVNTDHGLHINLKSPTHSFSSGKPTPTTSSMEPPLNTTVFTWQNVTYTIPTHTGPKILLDNLSGYLQPGRLTALMGESGAGKTTLLNALAQRLTTFGTLQGRFLLSGHPLPISFARSTGFAEQEDVHEALQTVREALRFSALLRQPAHVPVQEKYDYVETIIELLEMGGIAEAMVGVPGVGLNQEQRKRVTLGVELAARPAGLLFLDEPTSGLDSQAAFNIVRFLRKLANSGQAVLCTIHQPSAVLFAEFDDLILLKKGGKVVYHGPLGEDSRDLIDYFESNGARHCPKHMNPAEYMLAEAGTGDSNTKDWSSIWLSSLQHQTLLSNLRTFNTPSRTTISIHLDTQEFAAPWTTRTKALLIRTFTSYHRSPSYILGILLLHIFTALFNAFTFFRLSNTLISMQSRLFSIFMALMTAPPLIQQLQPRFIALRDLYLSREKASKTYSLSNLTLAAILTEIPYRLLAGTIYFFIWYLPPGFPRDASTMAFTWSLMLLFQLYYLSLGLTLAAIAPNPQLAGMLVPIVFVFVVSFCGVVVPFYVIPVFWRYWMYWLSPFTHLMNAFLGPLVHNLRIDCAENEFAVVTLPSTVSTCAEYLEESRRVSGMGRIEELGGGRCRVCQFADGDEFARSFNFNYGRRWREWGVFAVYVGVNFAAVFVAGWFYAGGWRGDLIVCNVCMIPQCRKIMIWTMVVIEETRIHY